MTRFGFACMSVVAALGLPLAARAQSLGYVTMVAASAVDPDHKVPMINGVPGSGISNYDLGFPAAILTHGQPIVVSVLAQNGTYNGTCTSSFALTQKTGTKTVVLLQKIIKQYTCGPGTVWAWVIQTPDIPDSVGAATLVGTVKYGTKAVRLAAPVYIQ